VLRTGRVDVTWTLTAARDAPELPAGQAVFRHTGRLTSFKVRLTKLGRRMLRHRRQPDIYTNAEYTPPGRVGGQGLRYEIELTVNAPAMQL
jgi:hypothetical protein